MILSFPLTTKRRRVQAVGLTFAIHLTLFYGWRMSIQSPPRDMGSAVERIQWLLVPPPEAKATAVQPGKPRAAPAPVRTRAAVPRSRPIQAIQAIPEAVPSDPFAEAPPSPAVATQSLAERARSSVGAIDKALRKANPDKFIRAPVITAHMRMQRGIQEANELAPNRWYQAPKVTEMIDPGGYGRKRYRVVGANGTYCVTYETNHAPDGIDSMQHGIKPKITTCPKGEQAATQQDWDPDL
ncbi:MAG: hypothetical protein ACXW2U_18150 [Telluria sp.]